MKRMKQRESHNVEHDTNEKEEETKELSNPLNNPLSFSTSTSSTEPSVGYSFMDDTPCFESFMNSINEEELSSYTCVIDSGTTNTILKDRAFFTEFTKEQEISINTIEKKPTKIGKKLGTAMIVLPNGTILKILNAIYAPESRRNLLSFGDLRRNNLNVQTSRRLNKETIEISDPNGLIVEEFIAENNLPITKIKPFESETFHTEKQNENFTTWHQRLGHPSNSMYYKIHESVRDLPKLKVPSHKFCLSCAQGKLIMAPFIDKKKNLLRNNSWGCLWTHQSTSWPFQLFLCPCRCVI